ncbi:transcriptional regulator GcvA [Pseudomonas tolaasii]|uniref:transcriptional regulator GcvA n=1 Tax=Pseudomonas tolaasii TaxID=29442 RepID=UPI0027343E83|nr:transcriptional regulator GcvA [Pseudomonas tolaasii]WLH50232.1 transcriptional regulator GcvA [Pseudomonas tolaasii]
MNTLLHLNALRAFEAAARHQSFSGAASELHVTSAAVGQQVRTLEAWLGAPLFNRASSGNARLVLTDVARDALPDIREGFDRLRMGLSRLKEGSLSTGLTVTVSPAFAAKWLLPRIEDFQRVHPRTDVLLDTNLKPVDFIAEGMDIGVRYGTGHWPGLVATKLMDEDMYPVCAPGYGLLEDGRLPPHKLEQATLIHDLSMASDPHYPTWRTWLDASGFAHINAEHGLRINNAAAVLQAAIDGQGLALGRSVMLRDDLAAGRLIRPFGEASCPLAFAYYIVHRPEVADLEKIKAFREWLLAQVSSDATALATSTKARAAED